MSSFTKLFWNIMPHKCNKDVELGIWKLYYCSRCGRNSGDGKSSNIMKRVLGRRFCGKA